MQVNTLDRLEKISKFYNIQLPLSLSQPDFAKNKRVIFIYRLFFNGSIVINNYSFTQFSNFVTVYPFDCQAYMSK